jgi:quercetin dioxygenase-like cupin family protein
MVPEESVSATSPGLSADGGERLLWMGEPTLIKATGAETGGRYSLVECFVTPAGAVPRHVHHREDEAFYVLEGELTFQIGDATFEAGPGSFVFGPRDVPHTYTVKTPTARILMLFSPAGFEGFIRATSEPTTSLETPSPDEVEVDFDKVLAAAAEYGSEILE